VKNISPLVLGAIGPTASENNTLGWSLYIWENIFHYCLYKHEQLFVMCRRLVLGNNEPGNNAKK